MSTNLNHQLHTLERIDLIRRASAVPELEFLFRHNLTQEAAYQSILLQHRRQFHQQVAQAIENLFPGRLEEFTARLGYHYFEAGDYPRAQSYYTQAGDVAYRLYANQEAADHYGCALEAARRAGQLESPDAGDNLTYLFTRRGRALELTGRYRQALSLYQEMEALARQRNDPRLELAALMAQGTIYAIPSEYQDHQQAHIILPRALELARHLNNEEGQARLLWNLMIVHLFSGQELEQGIYYGRQSLELARKLNLREQLAFTLNDLFSLYWFVGDMQAAEAVMLEARQLWQELGNLPMLSDNLTGSSMFHFTAGHFDQAILSSNEAYQIARSSNNLWGQANSRVFMGDICTETGRLLPGLTDMEEAIRHGEAGGHSWSVAVITAEKGWLYGLMGQVKQGLELATTAHQKFKTIAFILGAWPLAIQARLQLLNGDLDKAAALLAEAGRHPGLKTTMPHILALFDLAEIELKLAQGQPQQVLDLCDQLIAYLHHKQIHPYRADAHYYQAQALLHLGQPSAALTTAEQARQEAQQIGSHRILWQILALQSQLEQQRGDPAEAEAHRQAAAALIHDIADHAPLDLRTTFLNLPAVRAVLFPS